MLSEKAKDLFDKLALDYSPVAIDIKTEDLKNNLPQKLPYEKFPESTAWSDGVKLIQADMSAIACDTFLQVKYAEKDHLPLHLQIIQPRVAEGDTTTLFPLIVFIQGSAWLKQNCGRDLTQLSIFAKRGYVVAIVEHRPAYVAPFPAQIKDANTAVRFLVENGKAYHADCNNIIMWGTSSGAHTINMVNVTWNDPDFTDEKDGVRPPIKAFIDYYGPSDITRIQSETPTYEYLTKETPEGMLWAMSLWINFLKQWQKPTQSII